MNELALFAGGGGAILAGHLLGWRTVAAVECDAYCVSALLHRQQEGTLEPFPIWSDIRTFDGQPFRGVVDVITAGFPCQPFSVAGKRRGADDARNLWPDTVRILGEVRPRCALLENVPGLVTSGYFGTVLGDLSALGFDAEWCVLGAHHVGAPHLRDRLWILAYTGSGRGLDDELQAGRVELGVCGEVLADDDGGRRDGRGLAEYGGEQGARRGVLDRCRGARRVDWWQRDPAEESTAAESEMGRVAYGVAYRVDRLRALGNGWVPSVAALAWRTLTSRARLQP